MGYRCRNKSCLSPKNIFQEFNKYYEFVLYYSGYEINHQNEISTLEQKSIPNTYYVSPFEDKYTLFLNHWKIIKYKEEKGLLGSLENLLGNNNDYYGIEYINSFTYTLNKTEAIKAYELLYDIKIFAYIYTPKEDNENYFDYYSRTKKSIWTSFANICSLSVTIYNGFIFVFCRFYSNNFDNYKIIEKILSKKNKKNIGNNNKKDINAYKNTMVELSYDFDNNNLIEKNINDRNNNETNDNKDSNIYKEKGDSDKFENNSDDNNNRYLPKLHFYDFFANNIYTKKCCSSNKQEIIAACNKIILKYYSIEHILQDIIILENLLKDYKWNDPNLNDIQNNEMIKNLNSLI